MKSEKLNQWLTLGANSAVLVGLILLIIEISQNNEMMRAQTRSDVSDAIIDNIKLGMDQRVIAAYLKQANGQVLSAEDEFLLDAMANATLRLWENTHYQYRNGLFDDEEFEADLVVWREQMMMPEYRKHWESRRTTYSEAFRRQIDDLMD
jgi:hypothetical protein